MKNLFLRKQANALIVSVAVLMMLATMGITYIRMASLDRRAASHYANGYKASLVARAGIEDAIIRLREHFDTDDLVGTGCVGNDWLFSVTDATDDVGMLNLETTTPDSKANDTNGAGVPITQVFDNSTWSGSTPSFAQTISVGGNNRQVSGTLDSDTKAYTFKIFDTTSQLNLNSQIEAGDPTDSDSDHPCSYDNSPMVKMIETLSKAIAEREPYASEVGDANGPLGGLGYAIMQYRKTQGGFTSKLELLKVTGVTAAKLRYAWDFITVNPTYEEMAPSGTAENIYNAIRPTTYSDEAYTNECRCPVNINTASWPVLVAVLTNVGENGVVASQLSYEDAKMLAAKICKRRRISPFSGWDDFYTFLNAQSERDETDSEAQTTTGAFHYEIDSTNAPYSTDPPSTPSDTEISNSLAKIAALKANCDPNMTLRRYNPDAHLYQETNKTDLGTQVASFSATSAIYTTEFCFFPLGYFEITSLGQMLNSATGEPLSSIQRYAVVKIFGVDYHSTQADFESGVSARYTDYTDRQNNYRGFSYPISMQDDYPSAMSANTDLGYVMPAFSEPPNGYLHLGMASLDYYTNAALLFMGEFAGSLNAYNSYAVIAADNNYFYAYGSKVNTPGATSTPNDPSYLLADGTVIQTEATARNLFYKHKSESATADVDGGLPALAGQSPSGTWSDGSVSEGTIMFWFKISQEWMASSTSDWRTVFFSNHHYGAKNYGIQREIVMRVSGPDTEKDSNFDTSVDPDRPLLRTLEIKFRCKWYSYDSGNPVKPVLPGDDPSETHPWPYSNSGFVDFEQGLGLGSNHGTCGDKAGIHASEWYHLGVRWHNGVELEDFGDSYDDNAIIISGNFYDANDDLFGNPGPMWDLSPFSMDHHSDSNPSDSDPKHVQTVDQLPYTGSTSVDFGALVTTSAVQGNNYMWLGNVLGTDASPVVRNTAPQLTIDDVHVSKDTSWPSTTNGYVPSRWYADATAPAYYGIFQSKFTSIPSGSRFLAFYYTRREPFVAGSTGGGGGFTNPIIVQGYTLEKNDWHELWRLMTHNEPKIGAPNFDSVSLHSWAHVDITKPSSQMLVKIEIKNAWGHTLDSVDTGEVPLPASHDGNNFDSSAFPFTPTDPSTYVPDNDNSNSAFVSLGERMLEWYQNFYGTSYPGVTATTVTIAETAALLDETSTDFEYNLAFRITQDGNLYQSPAIDDVTVVYLPEDVLYSAYFDLRVLP